MRTIKLGFLLVFVCGIFSSFQAKSQAEVIFDKVIIFKDGEGSIFPSISSKTTLSPSGNIVKTANFQLPKKHYIVPEKGKYYFIVKITETDIMGNQIKMYDCNVSIDKSGEFKIIYHSNGAGNIFPLKYN